MRKSLFTKFLKHARLDVQPRRLDPHIKAAACLFGREYADVTPEQRGFAKLAAYRHYMGLSPLTLPVGLNPNEAYERCLAEQVEALNASPSHA